MLATRFSPRPPFLKRCSPRVTGILAGRVGSIREGALTAAVMVEEGYCLFVLVHVQRDNQSARNQAAAENYEERESLGSCGMYGCQVEMAVANLRFMSASSETIPFIDRAFQGEREKDLMICDFNCEIFYALLALFSNFLCPEPMGIFANDINASKPGCACPPANANKLTTLDHPYVSFVSTPASSRIIPG